MRRDLPDQVAAGEKGSEEVVLVAFEVEIFFHAGDIGITYIYAVEESNEVAKGCPRPVYLSVNRPRSEIKARSSIRVYVERGM